MRCKQARQWTDEYLYGTLSDEQKQELEEHLSLCSSCARYMKEMRRVLNVFSNLKDEDLSPDFKHKMHNRLKEVFEEEQSQPGNGRLRIANKWKILGPVLAGAALILLVYLIRPFGLPGAGNEKTMQSAEASRAPINAAAPADAEMPATEAAVTSLEESYTVNEVILYLSRDMVYEDILDEISSIASDFHMNVKEKESDYIIFHVSEDVNRNEFLERLSHIGRLEFSSREAGSDTITIQLKTE